MSYLKSVFVLGLLASLSNVAGGAVLERTAALGPSAVNLGTAGNFVILAKTGVSSVPASAVSTSATPPIFFGLSPAAASFITGFSLVLSPLGTFSPSSQVAGQIKAANYAVPTPSQLTTAYTRRAVSGER
ncbi:hypothetical protein B0H34DRAFT_795097 [Crassisporium funariophilum]|nr:hypothetical protein B0H34DRAFT_795097 [Crassisporium funariophilum]